MTYFPPACQGRKRNHFRHEKAAYENWFHCHRRRQLQTRKFIDLGITLPQFINRGQVIAQLPSLALLTLAGATPAGIEMEYIEVDEVTGFIPQSGRGNLRSRYSLPRAE